MYSVDLCEILKVGTPWLSVIYMPEYARGVELAEQRIAVTRLELVTHGMVQSPNEITQRSLLLGYIETARNRAFGRGLSGIPDEGTVRVQYLDMLVEGLHVARNFLQAKGS